jgi:hypothetical protein
MLLLPLPLGAKTFSIVATENGLGLRVARRLDEALVVDAKRELLLYGKPIASSSGGLFVPDDS